MDAAFIGGRAFVWRHGARRLDRAGLLAGAGALARRLSSLPAGRRVAALCGGPLESALFMTAARLADRPFVPLPAGPAGPAEAALAAASPAVLLRAPVAEPPPAWRGPLWTVDESASLHERGGEVPPPPADPQPADLLVFTSGSTGEPKGIAHGWAAVDRNSRELAERLALDAEDHFTSLLPLHHLYGFLFNLAMPLALGADLSGPPRPEFLPGDLAGLPVTVIAAARPHVAAITATAAPRPPRLRRFVSSGGALAPGDSDALAALWSVPVHNIYGSSECLMIAVNEPTSGDAEADLGAPLPSSGLRAAEDGELQVRSEKLALGYETGGRRSALPLSDDGWFRSGDLAVRGPRGFRIGGRLATTINVAGRKVSPEAVEAALQGLPGVADAAVCGYADPMAGERVAALLVPSGTALPVGEIRAALAARLPAHEIPRRIVWVSALPRLAAGKLDRRALPELLAAAPAR